MVEPAVLPFLDSALCRDGHLDANDVFVTVSSEIYWALYCNLILWKVILRPFFHCEITSKHSSRDHGFAAAPQDLPNNRDSGDDTASN